MRTPTEVKAALLKATDSDERVRLLCEMVVSLQDELFHLDKKFIELLNYFDQMSTTILNLANGTQILGAKFAEMLGAKQEMNHEIETAKELNNEN